MIFATTRILDFVSNVSFVCVCAWCVCGVCVCVYFGCARSCPGKYFLKAPSFSAFGLMFVQILNS